MQTTFALRTFRPTDLEQVTNINRRCLPENYTSFFFMNLYERSPQTFIVAEENGKVIGYVMCRIETGMSIFRLLGIAKKSHVISIAVLPEYRHQGVAHALMRRAMRAMRLYKAKECFLEVRMSNTAAVNLYKKMGFRIMQTMHGYYADGEAAYMMARKLPFEA